MAFLTSTSGSKTLCQRDFEARYSGYVTMTEEPERVIQEEQPKQVFCYRLTLSAAALSRSGGKNFCVGRSASFKILVPCVQSKVGIFKPSSMRTGMAFYHHFDIEIVRYVAGIELGELDATTKARGYRLH